MSWDGRFLRCDVCNSPWGDGFIRRDDQGGLTTVTLCPEHEKAAS